MGTDWKEHRSWSQDACVKIWVTFSEPFNLFKPQPSGNCITASDLRDPAGAIQQATAAPGASWRHPPPSWGQALLQVTVAPSRGGQPTLFFALSPLSPFSYSHKSCSRLSPLLLRFFFPSHFLNNLSLSLCVNSQITRKHLCKFLTPNQQSYLFCKNPNPFASVLLSCLLYPGASHPAWHQWCWWRTGDSEAKSLAQSYISTNERAGTPQSSVQVWSSWP